MKRKISIILSILIVYNLLLGLPFSRAYANVLGVQAQSTSSTIPVISIGSVKSSNSIYTYDSTNPTDSDVVVTLKNDKNITDVRYEYKENDGEWKAISGNVLTISSTHNTREAFSFRGKAGENISKETTPINVYIYKGLMITAVPRPSINRMHLEWNPQDPSNEGNYTYRVFKTNKTTKDNTQVFESIPLKKSIKVLNVYPDVPNSNQLQKWMQDIAVETVAYSNPKDVNEAVTTSYNFKDGMHMDIARMSLSTFNNKIAEASSGLESDVLMYDHKNYYDVVYFGACDSNNGMDLTQKSKNVVESYIDNGYGYLSGHDTALTKSKLDKSHPYFAALAQKYINIIVADENGSGTYDSINFKNLPIDMIKSTKVSVNKKGNLMNYPFRIGEIGTILTVPQSHSTNQFAMGNVWFKYVDDKSTPSVFGKSIDKMKINGKDLVGTNNFYLTTYNNAGIIQTGHSIKPWDDLTNVTIATNDEKMILANTLFNLSQVSSELSFDDYTSQDIDEPNLPDANSGKLDFSTNTFSFDAPLDNGTTYQYYVKAVTPDGNSIVTKLKDYTSNTITSGVKGYYISVNKDKTSKLSVDPKIDPLSYISNLTPSIDISSYTNGTYFAHVKTIDNAGNMAKDETVYEFTINNSYIDPKVSTFDLTPLADLNKEIKVNVTYNGNTLVNIKNGENVLVKGIDYVVDNINSTVSFTKDYLSKKPVGSFNLDFTFSRGGKQTLNVNVIDSIKASKMELKGTIRDNKTNEVIPNANIKLVNAAGETLTTTSDSNGGYSFKNLKQGHYSLNVDNIKYSSKTLGVDLEAVYNKDLVINVDVNLVKFQIFLKATPNRLVGDGKNTSLLEATVLGEGGTPLSNVKVVFSSSFGDFINSNGLNNQKKPIEATTGLDGKCTVTYLTDDVSSGTRVDSLVVATVDDSIRDLHSKTNINITFEPGSVRGVVIDNESKLPVKDALVTVKKSFEDGTYFEQSFTTLEDGTYEIFVPKGNTVYDISITRSVTINGKIEKFTYIQKCNVGSIDGQTKSTSQSINTIVGLVINLDKQGNKVKANIDSNYSQRVISASGQIIEASNINGIFEASNVVKGEVYKLQVLYDLGGGNKIILGEKQITISFDGELNLNEILVDPYGVVKDKSTGALIEGANVKLYYANTERNISSNKLPNTLVSLPSIQNFSPNDNKNPQSSDNLGQYAYMVFPQADYYMVFTKEGYKTLTSETIRVYDTIVKYDAKMEKLDPVISIPFINLTPATQVIPMTEIGASTKVTSMTEIGASTKVIAMTEISPATQEIKASTIVKVDTLPKTDMLPKTGSSLDFNLLTILGLIFILIGTSLVGIKKLRFKSK